jgi:hypothetical protein
MERDDKSRIAHIRFFRKNFSGSRPRGSKVWLSRARTPAPGVTLSLGLCKRERGPEHQEQEKPLNIPISLIFPMNPRDTGRLLPLAQEGRTPLVPLAAEGGAKRRKRGGPSAGSHLRWVNNIRKKRKSARIDFRADWFSHGAFENLTRTTGKPPLREGIKKGRLTVS